IPTKESLKDMRQAEDPPIQYLVGTPKGQLSALEASFLKLSWQEARSSVRVKLLAHEGEFYVLVNSPARVSKERAIRRRKLKAFNNLKGDLGIRSIFHQTEKRIEAHIFVCFLAYCVQITLRHQLRAKAPGLTVRQVLEKFGRMQMMDVHFPTTDGRELVFRRYTQPEKDQQMLLSQMNWELPPQSPPKITAKGEMENGYRPVTSGA